MSTAATTARRLASAWPRVRSEAALNVMRLQASRSPRNVPGIADVEGFKVGYTDRLSLFMEFKDIFHHGIYDFTTAVPQPRVIDGGSYIGMSMLRTKQQHPDARITCFEPDPEIRAALEANIARNGLSGVDVVPAALGPDEGERAFVPDGADGGRVVAAEGEGAFGVPLVPLSGYLDEPVQFLKLNIEGLELDVLQEAGAKLRSVEQMVIEYHGWPDAPQRLGPLLSLLDEAGYRYLVNHFDYLTNGNVRPPFSIERGTQWFALVYARRDDLL